MEDSKALSPETKKLFENIELLTDEYKEAFVMMERERRKTDAERRNIQVVLSDIQRDVDSKIEEMNKHVQENLATLRFEITKTIKVYGTIDSVVQLRKPLTELQTKLEAQSKILENEVALFIETAKADLGLLIEDARSRIKLSIEEAGEQIETRIINRQKMIEARMMENDQKIGSFVIQKNQEIAGIKKEMESMNKRVSDMNTVVTEMNKTLYELFDYTNQELTDRIRKLERNQ